jgi:hypothetical protein
LRVESLGEAPAQTLDARRRAVGFGADRDQCLLVQPGDARDPVSREAQRRIAGSGIARRPRRLQPDSRQRALPGQQRAGRATRQQQRSPRARAVDPDRRPARAVRGSRRLEQGDRGGPRLDLRNRRVQAQRQRQRPESDTEQCLAAARATAPAAKAPRADPERRRDRAPGGAELESVLERDPEREGREQQKNGRASRQADLVGTRSSARGTRRLVHGSRDLDRAELRAQPIEEDADHLE